MVELTCGLEERIRERIRYQRMLRKRLEHGRNMAPAQPPPPGEAQQRIDAYIEALQWVLREAGTNEELEQ